MPETVEAVDLDPEAGDPSGRFRTDGDQFRRVSRSIGNGHVLVDDVAFEMGHESLGGPGVCISSQQGRVEGIDPNVPDHLSFDVCHEGLAPLSGRQAFDVIRAKTVQEGR